MKVQCTVWYPASFFSTACRWYPPSFSSLPLQFPSSPSVFLFHHAMVLLLLGSLQNDYCICSRTNNRTITNNGKASALSPRGPVEYHRPVPAQPNVPIQEQGDAPTAMTTVHRNERNIAVGVVPLLYSGAARVYLGVRRTAEIHSNALATRSFGGGW